MKKKNHRTLFVFAVAILLNVMGGYKLFAQIDDRVCIEGHIFDKKTQEPICYAAIMLGNTNIGTTSDENGDFVFRKLKPGKYVLQISFIGYQKETYEVEVVKGAVAHAHIELVPKSTRLDDVVVSANRNETNRREAPVVVNVLSEKQFEQNNAQDLVQSLGFQSGVRVEYNCQNCGFPQVRINGLDGPYTQLLIDSKPVMSALSGIYGLEQIPVNMVERVEVVKGGVQHCSGRMPLPER